MGPGALWGQGLEALWGRGWRLCGAGGSVGLQLVTCLSSFRHCVDLFLDFITLFRKLMMILAMNEKVSEHHHGHRWLGAPGCTCSHAV